MKVLRVLALAVLAASFIGVHCEGDEFPEEDDVLVLGDDNLDKALAAHEKLLVEFYAPWCGHCKKLAPEYAAAAKKLKEHGFRIAKVDATENSVVAGKYEVKGYPTLKWFVNGTASEYNGGREKDDIVNWVLKKSGPASRTLSGTDAVQKEIDDAEVLIVFFGDINSDEGKIYLTVAGQFDDFAFVDTSCSDCSTKWEVTQPTVVVFKKFDEGRADYTGAFAVDSLKEFINTKTIPTIMSFDQKAAQKIFGEGNPALFVFRDINTEGGKTVDDALKAASEGLKGQILMSASGVTDGLEARLAEYIGVTEKDLPTARIIDTRDEGLKKYTLSEEITEQNLKTFYDDWKAGKLTPVLKSEDIPEKNDEPVKVIVGKSFNDIVLDDTKDVLVEFYAPWCGHCKALAPKYDELATKLAHIDGIVIAKMDATANEVDGINIKGFPTIKFWKKGKKDAPMDFNGDREVDGFIKFLKENGSFEITEAPEKTDL